MKKSFLLLAIALVAGLNTYAQITQKFLVTLTEPATGTTLNAGTNFNQKFTIKIIGPNAIIPTDTIAYIDPVAAANTVWILTGRTKAVNDTIQINKALTLNATATTQTGVNYCVEAFLFSQDSTKFAGLIAAFDTSGSYDCNSINTKGFPASTGDIVFSEAKAIGSLGISPNPATGNLINFNYISQNSDELTANVYDVTGRKVMSFDYGKQYIGKDGYSLDISSLKQGLYVVEMRQGSFKFTGRLLKD